MILDQATIYVITALISLVLGAMLLAAQAIGRIGAWAACWGGGNIALGLAGIDQFLQGAVPPTLLIVGSNALAITGCVMIVQGVRLLAGREARWGRLAAVMALLVLPFLALHLPSDRVARIAYNNLILFSCDLWIAIEAIRLARRERLRTAWIMVGLFAVTAPISLARSTMAVMTLFGTDMLDKSSAGPWLAALLAAFWALRGAMPALVVAERHSNGLAALARHDVLTGALNRTGLDHLRQTLKGPAALVMMDLDHFKSVNDAHGHATGDAVLRSLAETVRARQPDGAALVRLGGDEFLLVLPRTTPHAAERLAETIRADFAAAVHALGIASPMPTVSIGIVHGNIGRSGLRRLLARADEALYASKKAGRDRVSVLRLAA